MATVPTHGARATRLVAAVTAVLVLAGGLLVGGTAGATAPSASKQAKTKVAKVSDGTLTWGVSKYVLGANPAVTSLSEAAKAEPPATYTAGTGWQFTKGTGTYEPKTGAMEVDFDGGIEFGNTSTGDFGFRLTDPTVTLDAEGNGTLSADVAVRPAGGEPFGAGARTDVVTLTGATPTKTKKRATVTVTPTGFADPFLAAAADLSAFFQATGSASDANKPPEPLTLSFAYKTKRAK